MWLPSARPRDKKSSEYLDTRLCCKALDTRGRSPHQLGMYLRVTERRNRDGSPVAYMALAENCWNPQTRRAEAKVVHSFGRADTLDRDALKRLVKSINRV